MKKRRCYQILKCQELVAGPFSLRVVQDADIELIRRWRNDQLDVLRQAYPTSFEEQVAYFERKIWPSMNADRPENILLTYLEEGKPIGYGGLVHIAWEHRRAEISFLLDPSFTCAPRIYERYFSNYLTMIKAFGFSILGLNRLYTETYESRCWHIQILESNGFLLEGKLRQHVFIDDAGIDSLMHGILSSDLRDQQ